MFHLSNKILKNGSTLHLFVILLHLIIPCVKSAVILEEIIMSLNLERTVIRFKKEILYLR